MQLCSVLQVHSKGPLVKWLNQAADADELRRARLGLSSREGFLRAAAKGIDDDSGLRSNCLTRERLPKRFRAAQPARIASPRLGCETNLIYAFNY